jgi:lipopolysaccharide/colanic/teichoic acid biosynthesis glycosyltransferase
MNIELSNQLVGKPLPTTMMRNKENLRIRSYALLAFGDAIVITAGFLLINYLYLGNWRATHGIAMLTVLLPIYYGIGAMSGSYNGVVLSDPRVSAANAVKALIFAASSLLIIAYSFKMGATFSRFIFWTGTILTGFLLVVVRLWIGRVILRALGGSPIGVVVIRDGGDPPIMHGDIEFDAGEMGFDPRTDDPLHFDQLAKTVAHADRVLVLCSDDRVASWAHVLKCIAVDGEIVAPDIDRVGMIGVGQYEGRRTMVVSAGPLHLRDRAMKRIFDIVVSFTLLLVLLPLLVIVAVAIKLESSGPLLFRQQRIGRDNVLFDMLKFRSMYHDQCDANASVLTLRADSRVTNIGKFIRHNSIDEIPQLINVLRGDMSIVGPRPHALFARAADQLYWEIDQRYRYRHAVKPGMTGLAQVRGFRGATVSTEDLTNRLSSDLEYLKDWSLTKDLLILFRTALVLRHDNAF